jgi:hypothetical protein
VREKRDKRDKSSLPLSFPRFSRFSRLIGDCKPPFRGPATGFFLLALHHVAIGQDL